MTGGRGPSSKHKTHHQQKNTHTQTNTKQKNKSSRTTKQKQNKTKEKSHRSGDRWQGHSSQRVGASGAYSRRSPMTRVTTFDGPVPGEALAVGGPFSTGLCRKAQAVGNKHDQGHPCLPTDWQRVGEPQVLWGYGCRDASRTEARPENAEAAM